MILKNNKLISSFSNKTNFLKKIYRNYMKRSAVFKEKDMFNNNKSLLKIEDLSQDTIEKLSKYKINKIKNYEDIGSSNVVVKLRNNNNNDTDFVVSEPQSNLFGIVKDTKNINKNLDNIIIKTIKDKKDFINSTSNNNNNDNLINSNSNNSNNNNSVETNNNSNSLDNSSINMNTTNTDDAVNNSVETTTTEISNTIENNVSVIRSNILKLEDLSMMKSADLKIAEQLTNQFKNIDYFISFKWIIISLFGAGSFLLLSKFITFKRNFKSEEQQQVLNINKTNNLIDNIKTFIKIKLKSIYKFFNY